MVSLYYIIIGFNAICDTETDNRRTKKETNVLDKVVLAEYSIIGTYCTFQAESNSIQPNRLSAILQRPNRQNFRLRRAKAFSYSSTSNSIE